MSEPWRNDASETWLTIKQTRERPRDQPGVWSCACGAYFTGTAAAYPDTLYSHAKFRAGDEPGAAHDPGLARFRPDTVRAAAPSPDLAALRGEMADWLGGKRSWTNLGPYPPYTPDVIAAMDAQEVVKLGAAIQALAASPPPAKPDAERLDVRVLDAVFTEMGQRGWLMLPDGHTALTIRGVFVEAYARHAAQAPAQDIDAEYPAPVAGAPRLGAER